MSTTAEAQASVQRILHATSLDGGRDIVESGVQAVICHASPLPAWFARLEEAVSRGAFHVERTASPYLAEAECAPYLEHLLPDAGLEADVRQSLVEDILSMVALCRRVTAAGRVRIRCLTSVPNRHHGFHVDVARASPCRRVLRVYGAGTEFVEPRHVSSFADFYRHLDKRHALARQIYASPPVDDATRQRLLERLAALESQQPFLHPDATLQRVPRGATVVIESVQRAMLWPAPIRAGRAAGWVHRSPMRGAKRFVVSISNAPLR